MLGSVLGGGYSSIRGYVLVLEMFFGFRKSKYECRLNKIRVGVMTVSFVFYLWSIYERRIINKTEFFKEGYI